MSTVVHIFSILDKLKLLFFFIYFPYFVSAICPNDVQNRAKACFREYDMKIGGILRPGESIISGVDAENIRVLCTELKSGIACINELKSNCPQDNAIIEAELVQIPLAIHELGMLCRDDSLYEVYARNRICFERSGAGNEKCFKDVMNTTVRIITDLDRTYIIKYCSEVDRLLSCIGKSLEDQHCGPEAITLKDKLARTLIRGSQGCDKVSSQKTTPSPSKKADSASNSQPKRTVISTLVVIFSLVLSFSWRNACVWGTPVRSGSDVKTTFTRDYMLARGTKDVENYWCERRCSWLQYEISKCEKSAFWIRLNSMPKDVCKRLQLRMRSEQAPVLDWHWYCTLFFISVDSISSFFLNTSIIQHWNVAQFKLFTMQ